MHKANYFLINFGYVLAITLHLQLYSDINNIDNLEINFEIKNFIGYVKLNICINFIIWLSCIHIILKYCFMDLKTNCYFMCNRIFAISNCNCLIWVQYLDLYNTSICTQIRWIQNLFNYVSTILSAVVSLFESRESIKTK